MIFYTYLTIYKEHNLRLTELISDISAFIDIVSKLILIKHIERHCSMKWMCDNNYYVFWKMLQFTI